MSNEMHLYEVTNVTIGRAKELTNAINRRIEITLKNGMVFEIELYSQLDELKVEIE